LEQAKTSELSLNSATYKLDLEAMQQALKNTPKEISAKGEGVILTFPDPEGNPKEYSVVETQVMHPNLAKKYPGIKTYTGISSEGSSNKITFTTSKNNFFDAIVSSSEKIFFINQNTSQSVEYKVSYKENPFENTS